MKKILLVGDSHGNKGALENLIITGGFDYVFFAGDGIRDLDWLDEDEYNIIKVVGNCDMFSSEAGTRVINIEGVKFLLTHGHLFNAKRSLIGLVNEARAINANVVCFGHTHTPLETIKNGILLLNAGTFAYGHYAVIEVNTGKVIKVTKE